MWMTSASILNFTGLYHVFSVCLRLDARYAVSTVQLVQSRLGGEAAKEDGLSVAANSHIATKTNMAADDIITSFDVPAPPSPVVLPA